MPAVSTTASVFRPSSIGLTSSILSEVLSVHSLTTVRSSSPPSLSPGPSVTGCPHLDASISKPSNVPAYYVSIQVSATPTASPKAIHVAIAIGITCAVIFVGICVWMYIVHVRVRRLRYHSPHGDIDPFLDHTANHCPKPSSIETAPLSSTFTIDGVALDGLTSFSAPSEHFAQQCCLSQPTLPNIASSACNINTPPPAYCG